MVKLTAPHPRRLDPQRPEPAPLAEAPPSAHDHADPRIAAMLPAELLQPGETIILLIKPSPWFILLEPLRAVMVLLTLMVLTAWLGRRDLLPTQLIGQRDLILLCIGLLGIRLFWQFLEWLSRVYVLTDRRVVRVQGVLRVFVFETALKNVQHTNASFSVRERLMGLGTISFATSGTAFTEATWRMVAHPLEVHRIVVQTLQRYR